MQMLLAYCLKHGRRLTIPMIWITSGHMSSTNHMIRFRWLCAVGNPMDVSVAVYSYDMR